MDRWLELYQQVTRGNGGEPDAGRRLLSAAVGGPGPKRRLSVGVVLPQSGGPRLVGRDVGRGFAVVEPPDDGWFAILHEEILAGPLREGRRHRAR